MNKELPLVSVVVITYNSEKTILETLESIKNQTYKNLELIISDDCSKDNTVEVCEKWLTIHQKYFAHTKLITVSQNTGTAGNLNRGYSKANGIWIKAIAGDDVLMDKCIEINVNYILNNNKTEILISKVNVIGDIKIINKNNRLFKYGAFEMTQKQLLYLLLVSNFIPASTLFIRKDTFDKLGGFDENIPLLEDHPFWIKALINKKTISFNNEYTVFYRMSEKSISLSSNVNPLYTKSIETFKNVFLPKCQKETNILLWLHFQLSKIKSNKALPIKFILEVFTYINPIYYYIIFLFKIMESKSKKYYNN